MNVFLDIELTKLVANPNRLSNIKLEPHVCRHTCGFTIPEGHQHLYHEREAILTLIWIEHQNIKVHELNNMETSNVQTMHLHA